MAAKALAPPSVRIVACAIRWPDGTTTTGCTHADAILARPAQQDVAGLSERQARAARLTQAMNARFREGHWEEGYMMSDGRFVDRDEAVRLVGQPIPYHGHHGPRPPRQRSGL